MSDVRSAAPDSQNSGADAGPKLISDSPVNSFRQRRFQRFLAMVGDNASILDLGGTVSFWKSMGDLYKRPGVTITVVNPEAEDGEDHNILSRSGDACNMSDYADNQFDIVHSNSVIEHVGSWSNMQDMAREVRRLAPRYFVQTPNFFFPIEPHHKLPMVHWLPEASRARLLKRMGRVPADPDRALAAVERIKLIGHGQMKQLFPDAQLVPERLMGLVKSWMAIR